MVLLERKEKWFVSLPCGIGSRPMETENEAESEDRFSEVKACAVHCMVKFPILLSTAGFYGAAAIATRKCRAYSEP